MCNSPINQYKPFNTRDMKTIKQTKERCEQIYLDYFNNFITTDKVAEYYNETPKRMRRIIKIGRTLNHKR